MARIDEAIRSDLEARLIATIQGNATDLAKDYACRQLVLVGRDASRPRTGTTAAEREIVVYGSLCARRNRQPGRAMRRCGPCWRKPMVGNKSVW